MKTKKHLRILRMRRMFDGNVDCSLCLVLHQQLAPRHVASVGLWQFRNGEARHAATERHNYRNNCIKLRTLYVEKLSR